MTLSKNEIELLLKIYIGQRVREEGIVEESLSYTEKKKVPILLDKHLIEKSNWKPFKKYELYKTTEEGDKEIRVHLQDSLYQSALAEKIRAVPLIFLKLCFFDESSFYYHDSEYWFHDFYWEDGIKEFLIERGRRHWDNLIKILKKEGLCVESYYYVSTRGGELRDLKNITPEPEIKQFLEMKLGILDGLSKKLVNELINTRQDMLKKRENLMFDRIIEDFTPKFANIIEISYNESKLKTIEQNKRVLVFLSYSTNDQKKFGISRIAEKLTSFDDIQDALFWEEDTKDNIIEYMDEYVGKCDVMVLFCSPNALNSQPIKNEWIAAEMLKKPIIPVYVKKKHIPPLLSTRLNLEFDMFDFQNFVLKLHNLILKKTKK